MGHYSGSSRLGFADSGFGVCGAAIPAEIPTPNAQTSAFKYLVWCSRIIAFFVNPINLNIYVALRLACSFQFNNRSKPTPPLAFRCFFFDVRLLASGTPTPAMYAARLHRRWQEHLCPEPQCPQYRAHKHHRHIIMLNPAAKKEHKP